MSTKTLNATPEGTQKTVLTQETVDGSLHSYSKEEKQSIVEHINGLLQEDEYLTFQKNIIPIDPLSEDVFSVVKDGILIWLVLLPKVIFSANTLDIIRFIFGSNAVYFYYAKNLV